ncbi:sensor domain-containing protein, partial [Streptomyces sp. BE147]|uniref:sensor domain-containing protein n=1 Tax=Streptomyces sp. BE147 TaxID=3002524 RepID=UPI002E76DCAE
GFGALERVRARGLLKLDVASPAPARGKTGGMMSWVGAVLKSGVSWRLLLYSLLHFPGAITGRPPGGGLGSGRSDGASGRAGLDVGDGRGGRARGWTWGRAVR